VTIVKFPRVERPDASSDGDDESVVVQPAAECGHEKVTIDTAAHLLSCRSCGVVVDPITWLAGWSKRDSFWKARHLRSKQVLDALVVHAPSPDRWTLCGADSDKRDWCVRVSNLIREVTCQRCLSTLCKRGKNIPFTRDARIQSDGSIKFPRKEAEDRVPTYCPECGHYHPRGRCKSVVSTP
jgi:ribosomal protein S27E